MKPSSSSSSSSYSSSKSASANDISGINYDNNDNDFSSPPSTQSTPTSTPELKGVRLIATLVKSFIGSGVLFLPKAFSNGGWLFSILAMIFMAFLSGLCILRLLECRSIVKGTYGRVGYLAVGKWGQIAVDTSLVLSQAGFGCVYIVFIARNVLQLLNADTCWVGGQWLWLLILFEWPLFTPLTWVRKIAKFGPTNVAADVLIATGLVGILAYSFYGMAYLPEGGSNSTITIPAFNSGSFSLMLGTAVYAFEGVGMVLPVYDALSPKGQRAFPRTMSITLAAIAGVYILVGMIPYVYLAGMANIPVEDAITLNLPRTAWSYCIVAGYCVALLLSYPLMLFPAIRILEKSVAPYIFPGEVKLMMATMMMGETDESVGGGVVGHAAEDEDDGKHGLLVNEGAEMVDSPPTGADEMPYLLGDDGVETYKWRRNAYRAFIVAVTLLVAYVGSEQLDNFVSLIGAFCCAPLAFVYPCLFHLRLVKASRMSQVVDICIMIFGMGVLAFSTYEAVAGWSKSPINPCLKN